MRPAELESYRQKLFALGQRMNRDLSTVAGEALRTMGGEASGNLSNAPLHLADLGSDNFDQEISLSLLENQGQLLEHVSAALARIDRGTFGRCQECGKTIVRQRLEALPYTPHCVHCAARLETESA
jgi:RNA polymerase-binding transcription factor DksA